MPNCTEAFNSTPLEMGRLGRRIIEGRFDGGNMTSDAGVMLLAGLDRRLGLIDAAADCIADPRDPDAITHSVPDWLA
jgi:Transposase DDE domain group 1